MGAAVNKIKRVVFMIEDERGNTHRAEFIRHDKIADLFADDGSLGDLLRGMLTPKQETGDGS